MTETIAGIQARAEILAQPAEKLLGDCERTSYQGSGPGGQKRNRIRSGVRLTHRPTGLRAESAERREAERNLQAALARLRLELALDGVQKLAPALLESQTEPQLDAESLQSALPPKWPAFRTKINSEHHDFACCIFQALLLFALYGAEPKPTAAALGASPSAFVRLLQNHKRVFALANEWRTLRNKARLR